MQMYGPDLSIIRSMFVPWILAHVHLLFHLLIWEEL